MVLILYQNPVPKLKSVPMNKAIHKQLYGKLFLLLGLLFVNHLFTYSQVADLGKSYINVTKGVNGGTVETGDVLEIRASFVVRSGLGPIIGTSLLQ